MLKTQVITNTWKCDNCGTEEVSAVNPFFHLALQIASLPNTNACEIDLCQTCIPMIVAPAAVTYVASIPPVP